MQNILKNLKYGLKNNVDQDPAASQTPANQDEYFFQPHDEAILINAILQLY